MSSDRASDRMDSDAGEFPLQTPGLTPGLAPVFTHLRDSSEEPIRNDFFSETARSPPTDQPIAGLVENALSPQVTKTSRSIRLEAPPVVIRPPKVKADGFGLTSIPFLSWTRNSEKDTPDCARSTRWSYSFRSELRFLGLSVSRGFNLKTSEAGIDTAAQTIRFVSTTVCTTSTPLTTGPSGSGKARSQLGTRLRASHPEETGP
jgi:hypothetical protein